VRFRRLPCVVLQSSEEVELPETRLTQPKWLSVLKEAAPRFSLISDICDTCSRRDRLLANVRSR
jgi:hypothetical protein